MKKKIILVLLIFVNAALIVGLGSTSRIAAATYSTKAECSGNVLTVNANAPSTVTANTAFSITNVSSTSTAPNGITVSKIVSTSSVTYGSPTSMVGTWTGAGTGTFTAYFPDASLTADGNVGSQLTVKLSSIDLYVFGPNSTPITCSLANGQLTANKPGESLTLLSLPITAPVVVPTPSPTTQTSTSTPAPTTTKTTRDPVKTTTPLSTTPDQTAPSTMGTAQVVAEDQATAVIEQKGRTIPRLPIIAVGVMLIIIAVGATGLWFYRRHQRASLLIAHHNPATSTTPFVTTAITAPASQTVAPVVVAPSIANQVLATPQPTVAVSPPTLATPATISQLSTPAPPLPGQTFAPQAPHEA